MNNSRFPSFRTASILLAGALFAGVLFAGAAIAEDVTVIEKSEAKFVFATGDGTPEVFEIEGGLEVGESRQFFTEEGEEVVVLRTEDGYEVSIDGETIESGATTVVLKHLGEGEDHHVHVEHGSAGEGSKVKVIRLSGGDVDVEIDADVETDVETEVRVIRLHGGGDQEIEIGDGEHKAIFITSGEAETEHVWVSADDAHAYTFGDRKTALEHLESSGALERLDEETRAKVLAALRAAEADEE